MAGTDELERAIDELFVGPPEDFTESRNALANQLKASSRSRRVPKRFQAVGD